MSEGTSHTAATFTDQNFAQEVEGFAGVTLVDYWAAWCGPCHIMAPHIEALAQKYATNDMVKVGKLDVDANQETSMKYHILSLPTFKIFSNGEVIDEVIGAVAPGTLEQALERAVASARAAMPKAA